MPSLVKCGRCKETYPSNLVSSWKETGKWKPGDGCKKNMQHLCRECVKAKQEKYRTSSVGRDAENRASRKAYVKHKEKWIARAKARYAVKKGLITKPKWCEVCNLVKPLQGHHEDYSKPLEVIWLCTGCHAEADKLLASKVTTKRLSPTA